MTHADAPFLTWLLAAKWFRTAVAAEAAALGIPDMGGSVGPRAMRAVMMHGYKFSSGLRSGESVSLGSRYHSRALLAVPDLGSILESLRREEPMLPLMLACNEYSAGRIDTERPDTKVLLTHLVVRVVGRLLLDRGYESLLAEYLDETLEQAVL